MAVSLLEVQIYCGCNLNWSDALVSVSEVSGSVKSTDVTNTPECSSTACD